MVRLGVLLDEHGVTVGNPTAATRAYVGELHCERRLSSRERAKRARTGSLLRDDTSGARAGGVCTRIATSYARTVRPSSGNGSWCGDIVLYDALELRIPVTRGLRPYAPAKLERQRALSVGPSIYVTSRVAPPARGEPRTACTPEGDEHRRS